jgi:hypothetical protein
MKLDMGKLNAVAAQESLDRDDEGDGTTAKKKKKKNRKKNKNKGAAEELTNVGGAI